MAEEGGSAANVGVVAIVVIFVLIILVGLYMFRGRIFRRWRKAKHRRQHSNTKQIIESQKGTKSTNSSIVLFVLLCGLMYS